MNVEDPSQDVAKEVDSVQQIDVKTSEVVESRGSEDDFVDNNVNNFVNDRHNNFENQNNVHKTVEFNLNENTLHENIDFEKKGEKENKNKNAGYTYVPMSQIEGTAKLLGKPSTLAIRSGAFLTTEFRKEEL